MGEMLPAAAALDRIDDNILSEILLRLPPRPSSLPRASAVSKRWHGLACDPCFCRRFRRHHRRNAPLLGFFNPDKFLTFVPTPDSPNRVLPGRFSLLFNNRGLYVSSGSRHGLVCIFDEEHCHILVWDPVTGDQYRVDIPPEFDFEENTFMSGAVLRDASDAHFRVVLVAGDSKDGRHRPAHRLAHACVYSAETNLWGDVISMPPPPEDHMETFPMVILDHPAVLIGDSLYWQLAGYYSGILEFNLESKSLAVIRVPVIMFCDSFCVIPEDGGGLGFLFLSDFTAQLWKRKTDHDGVASWVLGRTIELDKLLSLNIAEHEHILIRGFAEENNVVFLSTVIGLFMVQLQSLQFTFLKHTETTNIDSYHPFESVYTAETRSNGPEEFDLSAQYIGWPE